MAQIYLIGFMGTGKSTVAKELARQLHRQVVDTDQAIVERAQMSIAAYFDTYGEAAFRDLEHQMLEQVSQGKDAIISCGGGVALREDNVACMKAHGTVFLLEASPETILKRVRHDHKRPLLKGKKTVEGITELMEGRVPFYQAAADYRIATDGKSPRMVAREIQERM